MTELGKRTLESSKKDRYSKKSSQACDNCRRRKVRCDVLLVNNGRGSCTICETQNLECTFEHVPRQRGPARGSKKIRRAKLEHAQSSEDISGPISSLDIDGPDAALSTSSDTNLHSNHAANSSVHINPDNQEGPHEVDHPGWYQHAIDRWFILYQPTFPILQEQAQFDGFGSHIDPLLRSALLLAIYSITFRSRTMEKVDTLLAEELLSQYNKRIIRERTRSLHDQLAHLQVTMLLAIEADQRGYEVATSVRTVGFWLGQATGEAYGMKLHREDFSVDEPAQLLLGRKLFLILIVLDRWHSVSTSSPPFVADTNAKFDIEMSFSGITNHLYHLSLVVGDVYQTIMTPRRVDHSSAITLVGLKAEIETWRERVDVIWGQSNLLHIAYWHLCILSLLSTSSTDRSEVSDLRDMALRMASTLPNSATPYTPLNHHFYALTTCVLSYLLNFKESRQDAKKGLHDLRDAIQRHKDLIAEDDCSWDSKLLEVIEKLQASCSASATCGKGPGSTALLSSIRRSGYLLAIADAAMSD